MDWVAANWAAVLAVVAYVVFAMAVAARLLAPLTETKVDDKLAGFFSVVYKALVRVLIGRTMPELPGDDQ